MSFQDHCIGSNETLFQEKLGGDYPPYYEGIAQDVFIRDPRDSNKYLEGEVRTYCLLHVDH